jgi:hypothetical protein
MGYDFMFMRLNRRESRQFPLPCDSVTEADGEGLLAWGSLRSWLIERGGRENGGVDSIWVDYDDGGSINFRGDETSVYLDVHARWRNVLEAYQVITRHEADCAIFDLQSGEYHDEASFRVLMRQNE